MWQHVESLHCLKFREMERNCAIGEFLDDPCGITEPSADLYTPDEKEQQLIHFRIQLREAKDVCKKHKNQFLTKYANHQRSCCDPFSKHTKKKVVKSLQEITISNANDFKELNLVPGKKWCPTCRKHASCIEEILNKPGPSHETQEMLSEESTEEEELWLQMGSELGSVNESLQSIGESPGQAKRWRKRKRYPGEKLEKITDAFRKKLRMTPKQTEDEDFETKARDFEEMIGQLKDKFSTSDSRSEKLQVLTVLPKSWQIQKIEREFKITNYMARSAKKLVNEKGVLSTPNPKLGKKISEEIVEKVRMFYESDDISRCMPGKKDSVSMIINGKKDRVQKRLILCNLKEAYLKFKDESNLKLGFSKFASLRPKNVYLPGGSRTHSVCVCTIHQNVKLMLEGSNISNATAFQKLGGEDFNGRIEYNHLLSILACNPGTPRCYLGECDTCGKTGHLKQMLLDIFEENDVEEVTYKSWVMVDRTSLETITKSTADFVEHFAERLKELQRHDFIAKMQSAYMKQIKDGAMENEVIIVGDFAEKYSFVLQDAAQGFH